jgi:RNA polymerase-binding protein DksA
MLCAGDRDEAMRKALEPRQLETLKASMRDRARQLRDEIRQTLIKSDSEQYLQIANDVRDLEDESFADLMVDVSLAEIDRDLEELRAIDAALLRVADGTYGTCDVCSRPIDYKRLEAAPEAARCIDCQTLYERTHFQKYGHTL